MHRDRKSDITTKKKKCLPTLQPLQTLLRPSTDYAFIVFTDMEYGGQQTRCLDKVI